jgi:hypothetical protein
MTSPDPELLTSLSIGELEALADGLMAPARHSRLDELLTKNTQGALSGDEVQEMDRLLDLADRLTILKTRARYTLNQLKVATAAS